MYLNPVNRKKRTLKEDRVSMFQMGLRSQPDELPLSDYSDGKQIFAPTSSIINSILSLVRANYLRPPSKGMSIVRLTNVFYTCTISQIGFEDT